MNVSLHARLVALVFLAAVVWPAGAAVSEGFVTGTVNVKSRNPTIVSNELGSTVFPGHALLIDVSGEVDINSYDRWEEDCFIGICKRREWVEHNWLAAVQLPVLFRVVDESGAVVIENQYTQNGRASIAVPQISAQAFNRKLRLEAIIPDGSPPINPARSQGQLSVRIQITTSARAAGLPAFLASSRATAQDLKRAWTYDPFFVEQNKSFLAKELIAHAKKFFPASSPLTTNEHRALLEYAGEIDPASSQVSFSVADMYLAQDNPAGAEKELTNLIRQLRQRPSADTDPIVQFALAEAHIKLASTIELARGYANSKDLATITANYTAAIDIASRQKAPELRTAALYARALAARSRNTSAAVRAAAEDFRAAANGGAATMSGLPVSVSLGGKEFAIADGASSAAVTWVPLGDAKAKAIVVEAGRATLLPLAVSQHGRVLARSREAIGWIDLAEPKPEFRVQASVDQLQVIRAQTNGKSSLVSVVSMAGGLPLPDAYLYRENFARTPVLIDGSQPLAFELAANAQRYVAIGSKGPAITLDLREIGVATESSLVRRQIEGNVQIVRISQDGKMFGGLFNLFSATAPPRRVLTVWTDAGQAVEVLSQMPATQPGAAPSELVETFDFVPGGNALVVATNYGQVAAVPITAGGQFRTLVAAPVPADSARMPALSFTKFSWAGSSLLFAESAVPARAFSIEWPAAIVRDVKLATPEPIPAVGVWADPQGILGVVRAKQLPFKVRSVRAADAKVIAETSFDKGSFGMQLLRGGRYACTQESGVELVDLSSQSRSTIAVGPSMAGMPRDFPEYSMCVASDAPDRWLLVTHTGGPIKNLTQYDGTSKLPDQNLLPAVPEDIVLLEKAAASRLGQPFVPPSFVLPHFRPIPGQVNVGVDGNMFAAAIPDAMWREAVTQPAAKWIGVPYIMLQAQKIEMKRVRLPAGSFPVKIVEGALRKVIYLRANKLFWKDLDSDSEGGQLAELRMPPPPPQFMPGPFPSYELRLSGDGARLLLAEVFFALPPARSSDIRIRAFQVSASTVKEMPCSFCASHTIAVDAFADAIPGFRAMPMLGPSDEGMNYVVNYADNRVVLHQMATGRPVVLLPRRPVFWVSEDSAYYISGENEISFLRF